MAISEVTKTEHTSVLVVSLKKYSMPLKEAVTENVLSQCHLHDRHLNDTATILPYPAEPKCVSLNQQIELFRFLNEYHPEQESR